jgi:hypothetical protein
MNERFVRLRVYDGDEFDGKYIGDGWGLLTHEAYSDQLRLIFAHQDKVYQEFGETAVGIRDREKQHVVDADETNTPDAAWAALAKFRLLGELTK